MAMTEMSERAVSAFQLAFTILLLAALVFYGYRSIHWPVIWDPSIMHYVNFLMAHGMAPYRDIIDINLPGSYFMDGWAMSVFGSSDLGWRVYEFFLLAVLIGSMIVIAWPYDWFAGLCAGALFAYTHGTEGARSAGQREELMITLILVGYAFLFVALRKRLPVLLLLFGFSIGMATSLKPTAALLLVLLPAMVAYSLRGEGIRVRSLLGFSAVGFFAAMLLDVRFFWHYGVFHDFLVVSGRLTRYYASIGNDPWKTLFTTLVNTRYLPLLLIGAVFAYTNARRSKEQNLETNLLVAGVLFGAASYLAQRKNFEHHMYPYFAFLLLWVCIEVGKAWKNEGWRRIAGTAAFALIILPVLVKHTRLMLHIYPHEAQPAALQADLQRLGGPLGLQHDVLCIDMVSSCYSTLYHLQILPYSNLVADYMLFPPPGRAPVAFYRDQLWNQLQARKPRVIVVTSAWLGMPPSFDKVKQWPALVGYLQANYDMVSLTDAPYIGYRLYLRKPVVSPVVAEL